MDPAATSQTSPDSRSFSWFTRTPVVGRDDQQRLLSARSLLRALPRPPAEPETFRALEALTRRASDTGALGARDELDAMVFEVFALSPSERDQVRRFVAVRAS